MIRYSITFNAADILGRAVTGDVMPRMSQTVRAVAKQAAMNWQEAVRHGKMRQEEKDAYAASITVEMQSDFKAYVSSDYKYAAEIESGRPPRDLKKMLQTSKKVRYVKNGKNAGKRFLIIPFQHNTPGNNALAPAMPSNVFSMAKMLTPSKITGSQMQLNGGTGARIRSVKRNTYNWGSRLTAQSLKAAGASDFEQRRYAGMVKMKQNTPGGNKRSGYLTFRVMGEWSSGWIVKAQPGQYLLKGVADAIQPLAQEAFKLAIPRTTTG